MIESMAGLVAKPLASQNCVRTIVKGRLVTLPRKFIKTAEVLRGEKGGEEESR